jgi:hypothetical protein
MSRVRIVTWNCRSGSVGQRLSELAELDPHLVFLQECGPIENAASANVVCSRMISRRKGIALLAPAASCRSIVRPLLNGSGRAAIAAQILMPVPLVVIGIWAQGPDYAEDVVLTLRRHAMELRAGSCVVMGDFNSGSRLDGQASQTKHHQRLLDTCADLRLVSAYHVFHDVSPGHEAHATYFHQFKRSRAWHIDFCFMPRAWASHLVNVTVIDGREWGRRSDHRPLLVEVNMESLGSCRQA